MKKTSYLGLSVLLIVALAATAWSQAAQQPRARSTAEYEAYVGFFNEKDFPKKAALGEKFLMDFKETEFLKDTYIGLMRAYLGAKNCPKVMELSDRYAGLATATPDLKVGFYSEALNCAQETGDITKIVNYGEKILAIEANNLNALLVLATNIPEQLPTAEAAKTTALAKAEGYANKAIAGLTALGKPQGMADADWNKQKGGLLGQLHGALGLIHLTRLDYEKAVPSFLESIKNAPKEWVPRYRLGLSYHQQTPKLSQSMLEAIEAENKAKRENADRVTLDDLAARSEGLASAIRDLRDKAIDQLATSVAIGGATAQPARDQLERIYKAKNNDSLDGLEALINEKKAQIASMG